MKITAQTLKKLIKEEYDSMLSEGRGPRDPEDPRQPYKPGPFEVPRREPYKPEDSVGDKIDPKDLKEQAPGGAILPPGALEGPMAFAKSLCAMEGITSEMLIALANQAIDNPAGAVGLLMGFLKNAGIALPAGAGQEELDRLVQLILMFEIELPFLGKISVKQALQNPMTKPAVRALVPAAVQVACSAAKQLGEDAPVVEHVTKDLLKQLVKEQLTK
jgi:hypothetical protein